MAWRVANSLIKLRDQVNAQWPTRSKQSDGTIGDPAHSSRTSDHNPDEHGIVRALDITHDPASGLDSKKLANLILAKQDPRLKYVISFNRIGSGPAGPEPGVWRPYRTPPNKNPHDHHCHVSVIPYPDGKAYQKAADTADNDKPWDLSGLTITANPPAPSTPPAPPVVKPNSTDAAAVAKLQKALGCLPTGTYKPGSETEFALKLLQVRNNLVPDGIAGPQTWKAIATIGKSA